MPKFLIRCFLLGGRTMPNFLMAFPSPLGGRELCPNQGGPYPLGFVSGRGKLCPIFCRRFPRPSGEGNSAQIHLDPIRSDFSDVLMEPLSQ